ncbi:hypothetical protein GCM10028791_26210 [Echinicola sediminis]
MIAFPLMLVSFEGKEVLRPLFLELSLSEPEGYQSKKVTEFLAGELPEPLAIELVSRQGFPVFYSSAFVTAVCEDEICELLHIQLFWDLTGNYIGYDTLLGHPLTKFDHQPFEGEDYVKLHELLLNEGSILKFKEKEELIDKKLLRASDVIDGTTGATALEIREEVVEGALYSSYTLWHLAHKGDIENRLTEQTQKLFDDGMATFFLQSDRDSYRLFAVEQMEAEDLVNKKELLLACLETGNPLLRKSILSKLPDSLWNDNAYQTKLSQFFEVFDINTRFYFLTKLEENVRISPESLSVLSSQVPSMSKNQLEKFLEILLRQKDVAPRIKEELNKFAQSDFRYAYLILDSGILE